MNTSAQSLIHLDGVTKVFFTDESRRMPLRASTRDQER